LHRERVKLHGTSGSVDAVTVPVESAARAPELDGGVDNVACSNMRKPAGWDIGQRVLPASHLKL